MSTVLEIITNAHIQLGVIPAGATLGADMTAVGLFALNRLVESWTAEQLALYGVTLQTITLTGASNYALSARPVKIEAVSVVDAAGVEQTARPLNAAQWGDVVDKSRTGAYAEAYYCDFGLPTTNIWLTPKPGAGTMNVRVMQAFTAFGNTAVSVGLMPGYEQALMLNLALDLAATLGKQVAPSLATFAAQSKDALVKLQADMIGIPATLAAPPAKG